MNWEAVGAISELIATVAVVVSLVYLAKQIRDQTTEGQVASVNQLVAHTHSVYESLASNKEVASTCHKGFYDFDSLDETETLMFAVGVLRYFRGIEALHFQYQHNRMDLSVWTGLDAHVKEICTIQGLRRWWEGRKHWFNDDFRAYLEPYMTSQDSLKSFKDQFS